MVELCCEYVSVMCTDCVFLSCHIRVQSESTFRSYVNIKELLARNRRDI